MVCAGVSVFLPTKAEASFNRERIIDNQVFDKAYSMSAGQIDAFLNTFPNSCISPNRGFGAVDPTGYSPSTGYTYGGVVTAGTVIAHAAQAYDINPQVLLATLQKEQSLVNGNAGCTVKRYTAAMGYGCPDSGSTYGYSGIHLYSISGVAVTSVPSTCVNSAIKAGFSQQVIRAAWLLKFSEQRSMGNVNWAIIRGSWNNSDDLQSCYSGPMTAGWRQSCPSSPAVYYDGLRTIDGTPIYIQNGATAALYWYTPHFHGNQNFYSIFTGWFGSVIADDTDVPHPGGTLISDGNKVYLVGNGVKHHITNGAVFDSYHYQWADVRKATTGDNNLPTSYPIDTVAPGTLFSYNGAVYITDVFNGSIKKQWLSYSSFTALGYSWSEVMQAPGSWLPGPTEPGYYTSTRHPNGTVISDGQKVYKLDTNTKRHVLSGFVFDSHDLRWDRVHYATAADNAIPVGAPLDINEGTVMYSGGNIYVVAYDGSGILKRPIGPWECYHERLHYQTSDWYSVGAAALPSRTGALYTC